MKNEAGDSLKIDTTYNIMDVPNEECLHHLHFSPRTAEAEAATDSSTEESSIPGGSAASGTILGLLQDTPDIWKEAELGEIQVESVTTTTSMGKVEAGSGKVRKTTFTVYSFDET